MSKKKLAALVATVLTAIAGALSQCPDDAVSGPSVPAQQQSDAGL